MWHRLAGNVGCVSLTPSAATSKMAIMTTRRTADPAADAARRIVIVCFPGVQPLDVTGPHEVFAGANQVLDHLHSESPRYELLLCADPVGIVTSESGLGLVAPHAIPVRGPIDTLLLPGGNGVYAARSDEALLQRIRRAAPRSRRIATVCSGTFLGAAAGLLDGRRVTTHWARAAQLAAAHPALDVDPDAIHINDGNVWTSAGVTAGIDLALALVEDDHGTDVAQHVARHLVMFLRRPGGQSQFAAPVWEARAERQSVRAAQDLVNADPAADLRVGALAAVSNMSERHFTRVFAAEVGEPPAKYVERIRVEAARRRLEQRDANIATVARQCGFGTAETMRRSFLRRVGVNPDDYRRHFATTSRTEPITESSN
ncbi:MAG: HTH-type transcriptional regulator glxA [Ilumatobacteraceae bacterium]|nr:HTH-type transcriptional regulator glxA [Ilumatobacteraceae bacterium]